jgi:hypothetical protein
MCPATGLIAGRVVDAAGNSVSGATVAVTSAVQPARDIAAITTDDGVFRLGGMRPGSYVIEARKGISVASAQVDVTAGGPAFVEITLA